MSVCAPPPILSRKAGDWFSRNLARAYAITGKPIVSNYNTADALARQFVAALKTKLRGLSPHANYTDRAALGMLNLKVLKLNTVLYRREKIDLTLLYYGM